MLLRSRYGLYGLPTEPELFDIDPPAFAKGSSTASPLSPYVFSVSAAGAANDGASSITIPPELNQQPSSTSSMKGSTASTLEINKLI